MSTYDTAASCGTSIDQVLKLRITSSADADVFANNVALNVDPGRSGNDGIVIHTGAFVGSSLGSAINVTGNSSDCTPARATNAWTYMVWLTSANHPLALNCFVQAFPDIDDSEPQLNVFDCDPRRTRMDNDADDSSPYPGGDEATKIETASPSAYTTGVRTTTFSCVCASGALCSSDDTTSR